MNAGYSDDVCAAFAAGVCGRLRRAKQAGDDGAVARLSAMETVLKTKLVPLISPDAILIAGQAAEAAHRGLAEREWFSQVCRERSQGGEGRGDFLAAVRLLKAFSLWPWQPRGAGSGPSWPGEPRDSAELTIGRG